MKGKLNAQGILHIERAGYMLSQVCPYNNPSNEPLIRCGHYCPLFGEPYVDTFDDDYCYPYGTCLEICGNRRLNFTEFTDERIRDMNTIVITEVHKKGALK